MTLLDSGIKSIELATWDSIKTIIDNNPRYEYDHSDNDFIQERIVTIRQSKEYSYYHKMKYNTDDYNDYENNYAPGATRGLDSTIKVSTTFADSFNLDAFSRLRVGSPQSLFDSKQIFDDQPLFWENITIGNGTTTYLPYESATRLTCTTSTGDKVIRQTREYFNYQPGKSLRVNMTGIMGAGKTNVIKRIGLFDDDNGTFFQQTSTGLSLVIRTNTSGSPVDTAIEQNDWNIDRLDGTGKSQITLDITKVQIWSYDVQWLGAGRLRVGLSIDGIVYYIHEYLHANITDKVYIRTPNLPLRYEIENIGTTASNTSLYAICVESESEGGYNPKGVTRIVSTGLTSKTVGSSVYEPVLSIRLKSTYARAQILPLSFRLFNSSNTLVHAILVLRTSLTGASFTSLGDNSIVEYDTSATAYTGGEEIDDMFVSSQGTNRNQLEVSTPENILKLLSDFNGTSDTLSVVVKSDGVTSNILASIQFREIY